MIRRGLFIGVNDYPNDLGPLTSCVNDAVAMQDACIKWGLLEAAETTLMIAPMTAGGVLPTRAAILDWLLPLYDAAQPIDRLIVYLSGHGLSVRLGRDADQLRTVFAPAGLRGLPNSGGDLLDLDELIGRFRRRGAREQVWIIDACRNTVEARLDVATIGWDRPAPDDPREALDNAWAAIFAVAPLARAEADKNGHGRLTRHLLDGLGCAGEARWGASADYDEASATWVMSCESLVRYAQRRVGMTLAAGDWRRDYALPQLRRGEVPLRPLRSIGELPDRAFNVVILPPQAAAQLSVEISARRRVLAAWPPLGFDQPALLAPEVYRLTAALIAPVNPGMPAALLRSAIDVRETDRAEIHVPTIAGPIAAEALAPTDGPGPAVDVLSDPGRLPGPEPQVRKRTLMGVQRSDTANVAVRVLDPACGIRLVRLSGGAEQRTVGSGESVEVAPGIWRLDIRLGGELVSSSTHDFQAGGQYAITPRASITAAIAALLRVDTAQAGSSHPPPAVSLGDGIGPMQGAILLTVLPLTVLRPFDAEGVLPVALAAIPAEVPAEVPAEFSATAATLVALALEGAWSEHVLESLGALQCRGEDARLVWRDNSSHVALLASPPREAGRDLVLWLPRIGTLSAPRLHAAGCRLILAATFWPDREPDSMVALVRIPDGLPQAAQAARARAVLTRLLGPGGEDGSGGPRSVDVAATAGDPILSALAWWWGRRCAVSGTQAELAQDAAWPALRQFAELPDSRVIFALSAAEPDAALDALLDDAGLGAPALAESVGALARRALARGDSEHWSARRFQRLGDAVFNVIFDANDREGGVQ